MYSMELFSNKLYAQYDIVETQWNCEQARFEDFRLIAVFPEVASAGVDYPSASSDFTQCPRFSDGSFEIETSENLAEFFDALFLKFGLCQAKNAPSSRVNDVRSACSALLSAVCTARTAHDTAMLSEFRKECLRFLRVIGIPEITVPCRIREDSVAHARLFIWHSVWRVMKMINEALPNETSQSLLFVSRTLLAALIKLFAASSKFGCQCVLEMAVSMLRSEISEVIREQPAPQILTTTSFHEREFLNALPAIEVFQYLVALEHGLIHLRSRCEPDKAISLFPVLTVVSVEAWSSNSFCVAMELTSLLQKGVGANLLSASKPLQTLRTLLGLCVDAYLAIDANELESFEIPWTDLSNWLLSHRTRSTVYLLLFSLLMQSDSIARAVENRMFTNFSAKIFGEEQNEVKVVHICTLLLVWISSLKDTTKLIDRICFWMRATVTPTQTNPGPAPTPIRKEIPTTTLNRGSGRFVTTTRVTYITPVVTAPAKCLVTEQRLSLLLRFVACADQHTKNHSNHGCQQLADLRAYLISFVDVKQNVGSVVDDVLDLLLGYNSHNVVEIIQRMSDESFVQLFRNPRLTEKNAKLPQTVRTRAETLALIGQDNAEMGQLRSFVLKQLETEILDNNRSSIERLLKLLIESPRVLNKPTPCYILKFTFQLLQIAIRHRERLTNSFMDTLIVPLWALATVDCEIQGKTSELFSQLATNSLFDWLLDIVPPHTHMSQYDSQDGTKFPLIRLISIVQNASDNNKKWATIHTVAWFDPLKRLLAEACGAGKSLALVYAACRLLHDCAPILYALVRTGEHSKMASIQYQLMFAMKKFFAQDVILGEITISPVEIVRCYLASFARLPESSENDPFYLNRLKDHLLLCINKPEFRSVAVCELEAQGHLLGRYLIAMRTKWPTEAQKFESILYKF